jgi:hypothetical protein
MIQVGVFSNCGVGLVSGDGLGVLALVHAELGVVVEYPKHGVLDYDGDALAGVYTADTEPLTGDHDHPVGWHPSHRARRL